MLCNLTFASCSDSPKKVPMQGLDCLEIYKQTFKTKIVQKSQNFPKFIEKCSKTVLLHYLQRSGIDGTSLQF